MNLSDDILRYYVRECIYKHIDNAVILEAKNDENYRKYVDDYTVKKYREKVSNRIKQLIDGGDSTMMGLLDMLGYDLDYDSAEQKAARKDIRKQMFNKELRVSSAVTDDILEVAKIISMYTDEGGNVRIKRSQGSNDPKPYLEDSYDSKYVNMILRLKDFIDIKGLTALYDKTANFSDKKKFGLDTEKGLDFSKLSDEQIQNYTDNKEITDEEAAYLISKTVVDQYIAARYGMKLEIPQINFSNGNNKLRGEDILIVNFDSAVGCPAWNECLVKHACYARNGEKQHTSVYTANKKKTMAWRATQTDETMMTLMMQLIKSYCFDFKSAANEMIEMKLVKSKSLDNVIKKLVESDFDSAFYSDEIFNTLMKYKRINFIRLNENGDFIGQWLVDAWDREAGKFDKCGIRVSAYTCRHLNFKGIKNIVLNTSFNTNNSSGNNIARNFIAVPENIYNALDETYNGDKNGIQLVNGNIIPSPQPLYSFNYNEVNGYTLGQFNGRYYYKCPCARKINGDEIGCYQCRLCYDKNTFDKPMVVFVKAHGSNADKLSRDNINSFGISANYIQNGGFATPEKKAKRKKNKKIQTESLIRESGLNNGAQLRINKNIALKTIATNAINSVYNWLKKH